MCTPHSGTKLQFGHTSQNATHHTPYGVLRPSRFVFLADTKANPKAHNRQTIELSDSAARSHAARMSSRGRMRTTTESGKPAKADTTHGPAARNLQQCPAPLQGIKALSSSSLDPFMELPIECALAERSLLHEFLTLFTKQWFPAARSTTFNIFREGLFVALNKNDLFSSWALSYTRAHMCQLRGQDPECDVACLRSRARAYRHLNTKMMAPEDDLLTEDMLYGVVAGGSMEYALGRVAEANKHLEAGLTLWDMRQSRSLAWRTDSVIEPMFFGAYIEIGVQCFLKSHQKMTETSRAMVQRMRSMQDWNIRLRNTILGRCGNVLHGSNGASPESSSPEYVHSRLQLSMGNSIVRAHVRKLSHASSTAGKRLNLAALYVMNTTLWASQESESEAIEFINDLIHYLTVSEMQPFHDTVPEIPPKLAAETIAFCGLRAQERCRPGEYRYHVSDVVQFVELMMMASESSRAIVTASMSLWLFADINASDNLIFLTDQDLKNIVSEIEDTFASMQATST